MRKIIRAALAPDSAPYAYYGDGEGQGITADILKATAERLGLDYEFIPAATKQEYIDILKSGSADVWLDSDMENPTVGETYYRTTEPYLRTTVSMLRQRRASSQVKKLIVLSNDRTVKELVSANWPDAEIISAGTTEQCVKSIILGEADGALLVTYTAQKLAREDVQNRLRTDIVQNASVELRMAVNADIDRDFYGLWSKTLLTVSGEVQDNIIDKYVEMPAEKYSLRQYIFDHPIIWVLIAAVILSIVFLAVMNAQSVKSRNKQKAISDELALALEEAKEATAAKNEFFSKMSHDIRTPLNAVLGMSQIAQKYIDDPKRLNEALDSISSEGNYLLSLIDSILDVNQLEYGSLELNASPFDLTKCVKDSIDLLIPVARRTDRKLTLNYNCGEAVVIGDSGRLSQIADKHSFKRPQIHRGRRKYRSEP